MKIGNRFLIVFLTAIIILGVAVFSGCGTGGPAGDDAKAGASSGEGSGFTIVATIFPAADWTRNILGSNPAGASLVTLLDSGVDPHSFQPSTKDILTVSSCDVFIYVGGESDAWVEDALREKVNPDMVAVNLLDVLGDSAREEELAEGMQEQRGKIDIGFLQDADEGPELDEHVWLSLRNAAVLCGAIEEALATVDPAHADLYAANLADYRARLAALDEQYAAAVDAAPLKTLLFGDRFPFRYLTEDYGLSYYAAFSGCSAETEASFETIRFLAAKLVDLDLPAVCVIDGSDHDVAETIIRTAEERSGAGAGSEKKAQSGNETGTGAGAGSDDRSGDVPILTLDSMQSVTADDVRSGTTYLSIMEQNLGILRQALGTASH